MKKLLLLFSFSVALSFSSKAQTSVYHPFPDSAAVWVVNYTFIDTCIEEDEYAYVFDGDTVINSYTYHKITVPVVKNIPPNQCSEVSPPPTGYRGAIRQDIVAKKVYFVPANLLNEGLLYNFSLNIGDTIHNKYWASICGNPNTIYQVTAIDSILIGTTFRKKIVFNNSSALSIIEGIGSITGLLEPMCVFFEVYWSLDCFSQNDTTLFTGSASQHYCDITNSVNNIPERNISITLSPNPFHTTATLSISDSRYKNAALKIYDVMGRPVQQQIITNQSTIINRNGLCDGLYFYRLSNSEGLMLTGKFVVE